MSVINRNDPCYCGSGRKYKKCCLKKDEQNMENVIKLPEKPKNSFRNEVKQSNPAQDMRNNQRVMLSQLVCHKAMQANDAVNLSRAIAMLESHIAEVQAMPVCGTKNIVLKQAQDKVISLQQTLETCCLNPFQEANLAALQQIFELPGYMKPYNPDVATVDNEPPLGPIETSDDDFDDKYDDDKDKDEDEEIIKSI